MGCVAGLFIKIPPESLLFNETTIHRETAVWGLVSKRETLQHTATHCNTLQHTATHCNTLQHTAVWGLVSKIAK